MTAVRSRGSTFSGFHTSPLPAPPLGEREMKAEENDCLFFYLCKPFHTPTGPPFSLRLTLGRVSRFAVDHEPEPQHTDTNFNTDAN